MSDEEVLSVLIVWAHKGCISAEKKNLSEHLLLPQRLFLSTEMSVFTHHSSLITHHSSLITHSHSLKEMVTWAGAGDLAKLHSRSFFKWK
jgi:hypothetical protein